MIKKLYSNTNLLIQEVNFTSGINIILGKYSNDRDAKGINGIGKSSLIRLINYCFLSNSAERIFSQPKYEFLKKFDHNVLLDFEVNSKNYTIKRYFRDNSEIHFGDDASNLDVFDKSEMKKILTNIFFPITDDKIFFEGNRYGTLLNFFVKDDLQSQKRFDPLNFLGYNSPNAKQIAIYNFFLLNLPTKSLVNYAEVSGEYDSKSGTIKEIESTIKATTGRSVEEFKTERLHVESRISLLEESLKEYNFLDNYKNIEAEIVGLTQQINDQLQKYHVYNHELKRLKELYAYDIGVDTNEIQKLLNETLETFGDLVKKSLDEVISFKRNILANRNKFLVKKEDSLQKNIDMSLKSLSQLEGERSLLYKRLRQKGALESIENTYKDLIQEKTHLERTMQHIRNIENIQNVLADLDVTISELKRDILTELSQYEHSLDTLRKLFNEILEYAIFIEETNDNAYFDVKRQPNSKRNHLPFKLEVEIPKAEALGQARLKIIAYDLMVFFNAVRQARSLPNFLIHDGGYHSISHKSMVNTLNFINREFYNHPKFQYITTFNEDEIEISDDKTGSYGAFEFDWKRNVVIILSDTQDSMLFKQAF